MRSWVYRTVNGRINNMPLFNKVKSLNKNPVSQFLGDNERFYDRKSNHTH